MSSGCNCGSSCKCGDNCSCSRNLNLGIAEKATTETVISGVATVKMNFEGSEMNFGAEKENGCKCGSNCNCDPCNC